MLTTTSTTGKSLHFPVLLQMARALDVECAFEELSTRAKRGYACDNTVNIEGLSFDDAKKELIKHVGNCIQELEDGSHQTVTKFFIGKTFVDQKTQAGGGYLPLNPQDSSTYKKDGIVKLWRKYKIEDYGRDGMVVLTIVTADAVPQAKRPLHQENYTRELKIALIEHFKATPPYNEKIANKDKGKKGKKKLGDSPAYALCMAYSLEEEREHKSKEKKSVGDSKEAEIQQMTDQLTRLKTSS